MVRYLVNTNRGTLLVNTPSFQSPLNKHKRIREMMRNITKSQKDRVQKTPSSVTPGQQTSVLVEASTKHSTLREFLNMLSCPNGETQASRHSRTHSWLSSKRVHKIQYLSAHHWRRQKLPSTTITLIRLIAITSFLPQNRRATKKLTIPCKPQSGGLCLAKSTSLLICTRQERN
jgi:hypothetical protein